MSETNIMTQEAPEGFIVVPMFNPFVDTVGPLYSRLGADPAKPGGGEGFRVGLRVEERHLNPGSVAHGGLMMTVVDNLMGALTHFHVGTHAMATVSLNCDFLSAAKTGDWIEGSGEVTRRTRSMVFIRALLEVEGRPILSAAGVMKLLDKE
jgi:uncharacterized protein (TIGR00369 family)